MTVKYKDTWLKIIGSLFIAHFIDVLGKEETLWELLLQQSYYIETGSGFVIAYLTSEYISRIVRLLDTTHDWTMKTTTRLFLQLGAGVVAAVLLVYGLVYLQFRFVFNEPFIDEDWLLNEFPVAIVFVVFVNGLYTGYYFFERWRRAEAVVADLSGKMHSVQLPSEQIRPSELPERNAGAGQKKFLLARKGVNQVPISPEQIAFVYKDDALNYLVTFAEETFIIDNTLEEVEHVLDASQFFRTNRQSIINLAALASFSSVENGKIKVVLSLKSKPDIIVSQKRAPAFRAWIRKKHLADF
jgi:hypothetical protein